MDIHFKITGYLLMVLGSVHVIFPRYFNWQQELKPLSLVNRQMMKVHTFFIALAVFLMGLLCTIASNELLTTKLGKIILLGLTFFWGFRLVFQFFVYSPKLWKGKLFETVVHVSFSLLWSYITCCFLVGFLSHF